MVVAVHVCRLSFSMGLLGGGIVLPVPIREWHLGHLGPGLCISHCVDEKTEPHGQNLSQSPQISFLGTSTWEELYSHAHRLKVSYTPDGPLKYTLWIFRNFLSEHIMVIVMMMVIVILALTKSLLFLGVLLGLSQQFHERSIVSIS